MPGGIDGVTSNLYNAKDTRPMAQDKTSLSVSDFYKLLAAQMRYQDADNPMNTSEMMGQLVQSQMVEAITNMSAISTTQYAASMVGKEVTVADVDANGQFTGKTTGVVTGVVLGSNPFIYIGNKAYSLAQIMFVGKEPVPEDTTKPDETKPEDGKGDGEDKVEGTT